MSQSRSPTPTPTNLSSSNIVPDLPSTTSRPDAYDNNTTIQQSGESEPHPNTSQSSHLHSLVPTDSETSTRPSLLRQVDSSADQPMAKRLRRSSPEPRVKRHLRTSPSSDSQGGMGDSEMNFMRSAHSEHAATSPPPTKKKRTRTLTTPHQSEILHALLAKSRFPTTAVREQVGKAIGLSARKVQIWFQNQRQKARRPRSQSDIVQSHLPQYGPFHNSPNVSMGSFSILPEQGTSSGVPRQSSRGELGYAESSVYPASGNLQPPVNPYASPIESQSQLLGPGMPGSETYATLPSHGNRHGAPASSIPSSETNFSREHTHSGPIGQPTSATSYSYPPPLLRPVTSQPRSLAERDPSRVLPPLPMSRPSTSIGARRGGYVPPLTPFSSLSSPSPDATRFTHQLPESFTTSPITVPPPFALQPQPRWDEASFSSVLRPSSSAWSRPDSRSTLGRSVSPIAPRRNTNIAEPSSAAIQDAETAPHHQTAISPASPPLARSGRYDPVRATFIPYSTPIGSPADSPSQNGDNAEDAHTRDYAPLT